MYNEEEETVYKVKWTTANAIAYEDSSNTSWDDIDCAEDFDSFIESTARHLLDATDFYRIDSKTWVVEFPTVDHDGEDIIETMWAHLEEE